MLDVRGQMLHSRFKVLWSSRYLCKFEKDPEILAAVLDIVRHLGAKHFNKVGEDGGDVVAGMDGATPVEEMGRQADGQQLREALADVPGWTE